MKSLILVTILHLSAAFLQDLMSHEEIQLDSKGSKIKSYDAVQVASVINIKSSTIAISPDNKILVLYDYTTAIYSIFDITDPASPERIVIIPYSSLHYVLFKISSDSKIVFAVNLNSESAELLIIDLSDYKILKDLPLSFVPRSIALSPDDKTIFASSKDGTGAKITAINVTDPSSAGIISSLSYNQILAQACLLSLFNDYLFCLDLTTLHVFDVSNPLSMQYINNVSSINGFDMAISCDGKYGYLVGQEEETFLTILDISDPSSIINVTSKSLGKSILEYDTHPLIAVTPNNKYIFVAGSENLIVINATDLNNLSFFKTLNSIYVPRSVIISSDGRRAFITNSHQVVLTEIYLDVQVDHTFSLNWNVIKRVPPANESNLRDMAMSSDQSTVFMLHADYLEIIDVSNLTSPASLSVFYFTEFSNKEKAHSIVISPDNKTAFVGYGKDLVILDISNFTCPSSLSTFPINISKISDIAVSLDGRSVFAPTKSGLDIIDVSDLKTPAQLNMYPAPDGYEISSFTLSGDANTAFILFYNEHSEDSRLERVNISNLKSLRLINITMPIRASSIILTPDNEYLFLALGTPENNITYILNVTDLKSPTFIQLPDIVMSGAYPLAISAPGSTIFIFSFPTLLVIDISSITSSRILRSFSVDNEFRMILSQDETTAFLGREDGTLVIVDLQPQYALYMLKSNILLGESIFNTLEPFQRNKAKKFDFIDQSFSFVNVSLFSIETFPDSQSIATPNIYSTLPNWMIFDQKQGTLTITPTSPSHIGSYQIYGAISTQIPKNAFINIGNITNETESLGLITSLISLGYMDTKRFLTSNFDPSADLVLFSQYSQNASEIKKKMMEYYIEMITSFSVDTSFSLSFSKHISVSSMSCSTLSITFSVDSSVAQFVKGSYAAVSTVTTTGNQSTINLEGSLVDINAALTQVLINLDNNTTQCSGSMTVSDGLNPLNSLHIDNLSQYFEHIKAPTLNLNFSIQNEIDILQITMGKQFVINLNGMFLDSTGQKLEYTLKMQDGSDPPDWIRGDTITGTPPEQFSNLTLDLIVIASNQYKNISKEFTVNIGISLSFLLERLLEYGGPLMTLIGLWIYIPTIYNIFCKKRYRYPKEFLTIIGDENSVKNLPCISFVGEEVKASKVIFKEIQKNIAKELKCKSVKIENLVNYFGNPETRNLNEDKLIQLIDCELATVVNNITNLQSKGSPPKVHLRKKIIYQVIANQIIMKQLTLQNEKLTKQVFNNIKGDWANLIEVCHNTLGFKINREKMKQKLKSIGVNPPQTKPQETLPCQSDHLINLKKSLRASSKLNNEQNSKNGSDSFEISGRQLDGIPLNKKNKSKEASLINNNWKEKLNSRMLCINYDLLEQAIIAHAFSHHNINISRDQVRVIAKKKATPPILFQRLRQFLKRDLLVIEHHWGNNKIYGIECKIEERILRFSGTPELDLKNNTIAIQITNRRGRIRKEFWVNCISNDFEEEAAFNEEALDLGRKQS